MPRKETYWANPKKYRKQARQYSRNHYVPRKKKKAKNNTFGTNKKTRSNNNNKPSGGKKTTIAFDEMVQALEKHYSSGYSSKKLKKMCKLGQTFLCQGQAFMPLSIYKKAYKNKHITGIENSHIKGEQGTIKIIPYIENSFPSPTYLIYLNPVAERGIDFLITKDATPYVVIELTNYQQQSFLHSREIKRYIKSLNYLNQFYPDIYKIIIVNYPENLKNNPQWKDAYKEFVANKIGIKIMR